MTDGILDHQSYATQQHQSSALRVGVYQAFIQKAIARPTSPRRKFWDKPFAIPSPGFGLERMAPKAGEAGWGVSLLMSLLYATSQTGLGMDFDLGVGFAAASGFLFDMRYGIGPALWLGRNVLLAPMVGFGLNSAGSMVDFGASGFAGGHLVFTRKIAKGWVSFDLRSTVAFVTGRDREYRVGGRIQAGHYSIGVEWRSYTNNGSQLTFLLGFDWLSGLVQN